MVRVVIRPWPVSMSRRAIGVCDQGSASSAAKSPGWFCLTVTRPRAAFVQVAGVGALGMECVRGDHRAGQVDTGLGEPVE